MKSNTGDEEEAYEHNQMVMIITELACFITIWLNFIKISPKFAENSLLLRLR